MPKPRKHETIQCVHFSWRLSNRQGVWQADGRSNTPSAGRHSLGTHDKDEALRRLSKLDRQRAEDLGLVPRLPRHQEVVCVIDLEHGRKLYEAHIRRPRVMGGTKKSTQKRYRAVFDKFVPFCSGKGVTTWNGVSADLINAYVVDLESKNYAHKTLLNEVITLKQILKWLIKQGHIQGMTPPATQLRKAETVRAYCYRSDEVKAMVDHCRSNSELDWLGDVIVTLACTGMRISELVSLQWSDLDFDSGRLTLTDETGLSNATQQKRQLKSSRSRSFPMHPDLLALLQSKEHRGPYVFYGPKGGRLKPDTVRRILERVVLKPLAKRFPSTNGKKSFVDGRLHSFRHYFCSTCANNGVPERMVMEWLGHADSEMIRHYYHLHDQESQCRMRKLDFLGGSAGRSSVKNEEKRNEEIVEQANPEA